MRRNVFFTPKVASVLNATCMLFSTFSQVTCVPRRPSPAVRRLISQAYIVHHTINVNGESEARRLSKDALYSTG